VVTAAAIALFLMMLSAMQFSSTVVTTVTGLALTAWLVQGLKNLDGWDDSRREAALGAIQDGGLADVPAASEQARQAQGY
jgi:uncharacterized membrane protein